MRHHCVSLVSRVGVFCVRVCVRSCMYDTARARNVIQRRPKVIALEYVQTRMRVEKCRTAVNALQTGGLRFTPL